LAASVERLVVSDADRLEVVGEGDGRRDLPRCEEDEAVSWEVEGVSMGETSECSG
jgi:hypothetical protein